MHSECEISAYEHNMILSQDADGNSKNDNPNNDQCYASEIFDGVTTADPFTCVATLRPDFEKGIEFDSKKNEASFILQCVCMFD